MLCYFYEGESYITYVRAKFGGYPTAVHCWVPVAQSRMHIDSTLQMTRSECNCESLYDRKFSSHLSLLRPCLDIWEIGEKAREADQILLRYESINMLRVTSFAGADCDNTGVVVSVCRYPHSDARLLAWRTCADVILKVHHLIKSPQ